MNPEVESFGPLLTQVNQPPEGVTGIAVHAGHESLPTGLGMLVRAGASLRRALLISLALFLVGMAELAVLLLYPGPEVAVVWDEQPSLPLVEGP